MPTCHIHGWELIDAVVPIRYGYPAMDETWDLERENPHHGLYELGGCVISPDSPKTSRSIVCPTCRQNVKAGHSQDNEPA